MAEVHSLEDIAVALEKRASTRVVYTYKLPPKLAQLIGYDSVGVVELTPAEMLKAQARAGASNVAIAFELAKECWRKLGAVPLTTLDESADSVWGKDAPGYAKLRGLIVQAYQDVHNPTKEENEGFLASQSASVQ